MSSTMHACSAMTAPRPWKELGDRIRAAREAAGISRPKLAARLGCSEHNIYRWEGGLHRPDTDNLFRIAEECGVSVAELRGDAVGAENPEYKKFLVTRDGRDSTEAERRLLLSMPWDREPTELSYVYALQAIRAQQSPSEAAASAEETEEMLQRGLDAGRRMLSDEKGESTRVRKR